MKLIKRPALIVLFVLVSGCYPKHLSSSVLNVAVNAQENNNARDRYEGLIHIQSDSSSIEKDKPYQVSVTINNKSGKQLSLNSYPTLFLRADNNSQEARNVSEDGFYSMIYLEADSEFQKKDSLAQGESICFKVDITKLEWGSEISAFQPRETLFEAVPKGNYILYLKLPVKTSEGGDSSVTIHSNQIKVTIK